MRIATMTRVPTSVQRHVPPPVVNSQPIEKSAWAMPTGTEPSLFIRRHATQRAIKRKPYPSRKQNVKAFLREVMIMGQNIHQTFTAHGLHRDAIGQAVFFVQAGLVEAKTFKKGRVGLRQ